MSLNLPSLIVLGTDTGVGKTVVTSLLVEAYRELGTDATPFKPIVSGEAEVNERRVFLDTEFLARAARVREADVGLFRFPAPLSPHLAAARSGQKVDIDLIIERFLELQSRWDAVIVEGVGGAMVPITSEIRFIDLAAQLGAPAVIVARAGLGTINHTLLTVEACRSRGVQLAGLIISGYPGEPDEAERTNPEQLRNLTGLPLLGLIPELDLSVEELRPAKPGSHSFLDLEPLQTSDTGSGENRRDDQSGYQIAIEADRKYVWHPFSPMQEYLNEKPHPLMIVRGDGCELEDSDGQRYIDGVSSLWVNVHGHRHPALDRAVREQLNKVAHSTLLGLANEPAALLAEKLVEITPPGLEKVFYSDSGSTAVEIALKVAFQYHKQTGRAEKQEFVTFANAYHGDTIGAVSVGGHELFHSIFEPLLFAKHLVPGADCYRCPVDRKPGDCSFACLSEFEQLLSARSDTIAALIFEPKVQGAAGIIVQPQGYLRRVADLCREFDVLLIADEVATGFGRTGPVFACELEGIEPDIMTTAKGLTGGYLPLAATLFRPQIYDAFLGRYEELKTFFHGHTYTGNPLAAAVALASIELLQETDILEQANRRAGELRELLLPLATHQNVGDIRQCGLMVGVELVADKTTKSPFAPGDRVGRAVTMRARDEGVIIRPLGDVLVLMPPLAIDSGSLKRLVESTARAIDQVLSGGGRV